MILTGRTSDRCIAADYLQGLHLPTLLRTRAFQCALARCHDVLHWTIYHDSIHAIPYSGPHRLNDVSRPHI